MTRWIGFEQALVEYERPLRSAGKSSYSLGRMVSFAWDGMTSFSSVPLQAASVFGLVVSFFGWVYFVYVVAVRLFTASTVPGWTSVVVAVLILGGAQLLCLGIIGQYLGRVYDETKGRPLYIVADRTAEPALPAARGESPNGDEARAQRPLRRGAKP
jgi:dolichol-phosphate mannosyltransferase